MFQNPVSRSICELYLNVIRFDGEGTWLEFTEIIYSSSQEVTYKPPPVCLLFNPAYKFSSVKPFDSHISYQKYTKEAHISFPFPMCVILKTHVRHLSCYTNTFADGSD